MSIIFVLFTVNSTYTLQPHVPSSPLTCWSGFSTYLKDTYFLGLLVLGSCLSLVPGGQASEELSTAHPLHNHKKILSALIDLIVMTSRVENKK